jgi:hypothetical protein
MTVISFANTLPDHITFVFGEKMSSLCSNYKDERGEQDCKENGKVHNKCSRERVVRKKRNKDKRERERERGERI